MNLYLYVFKIGVYAGIIMGAVAMVLNLIRFTSLDLTKYFGGLLTGQPAGKTNFVAGFVFHLIVAGILANIYVFILGAFYMQVNLQNALYFGSVHTIISGCLLPILDRMNPCVAHHMIRPMGYFASKYGVTAVITFVAGHLLFAVALFWMMLRGVGV